MVLSVLKILVRIDLAKSPNVGLDGRAAMPPFETVGLAVPPTSIPRIPKPMK